MDCQGSLRGYKCKIRNVVVFKGIKNNLTRCEMVEGDSCPPEHEVEFQTPRRIKAQMRRALGLKRLSANSDSVSVYRQHIESRLMRLCAKCRGQGNFVTCGACHRRHRQLDGLFSPKFFL